MVQYITYNGTLTVNTTHTLIHILQVQILLLHTEYWYTYYRPLVHILHWYTCYTGTNTITTYRTHSAMHKRKYIHQ